LFNKGKINRTVAVFFKKYEIDLDPLSIVGDLNLSDRVMVDFCKHIFTRPKILILDETLEQLSNVRLQKVIPILHDFKVLGTSILFITHRVDDIYEIADRVSIMRDGKILVTEDVKNIDKINLIKLAYTQVIKEHSIKHMDIDFYNLLKYNEAILTHLPFSLLVTDTKRNVRLINDAAKTHFGVRDSSHLDISLKNLLGDNNREVYSLLKDRIIQQKEEYFFNVQMNTKKGKSSQNISILPLFDGKLFIGNIITMEDVTEYENLRRQLSLSENLSSIGLLAAGVAHEINNPLEIINYYMQNLKLTNPENKNITEAVQDVEEEIVTISQIIENLLLFSENKKLETEDVEINSLLSGIIHLLRKSAEKRNIVIEFTEHSENLYLHASKTELKQVFLNIFKNSFEALRDTGTVLVKTSLATNETESKKGRNLIQISFSDDGPGIDNKIVQSIFMPFFSTKNKPSPNMGLGLSITYNIVTKYGGIMTMKNKKSGGCETLISFPAAVMTES
jgi:signal transduction histidine kinase